jgi:adenine-specific DNA-methyltransferase
MPTLNWVGKDKVINHHRSVPYKVLEHKYGFNKNDGEVITETKSGNKIIHGDNLEALKSLLPEYEGKIKCIYIDPPYNTGNEKWVYNDNVSSPRIQKWLGEVVGKESEDLVRDDKWLCMLYPRLKLLHKLLSNDGAIFISIDDNEQANLKLICDEIFGKRNFVAQMIWQKRTSPDSRKKISCGHEYIVVYVKNINSLDTIFNHLTLEDHDAAKFKNPDNDPRGPWVSTDFTAQGFRPNQMYVIKTPGGVEYSPSNGHCWKNIESVYNEQLKEGRFWFGANGCGMPRRKTYLYEKEGKNSWTWWTNKEVGHTQEATQELTDIFGSKTIFDYPKPVRLIRRILQLSTNKEGIVLDSFAGSGTTGQAVLEQNKIDGGNRKVILIEMEEYANSITAERIKRVIKGYSDKPSCEGSFDFYELGEPLFIGENREFINEALDPEKIREYVWYSETRIKYKVVSNSADSKYFLGKTENTAYYFFFEKDVLMEFDFDLLAVIKTVAEQYVIYADNCLIPDEFLLKNSIVYKKIPRDITRF